MNILKPELLTASGFQSYGEIIETGDLAPITINNGNCLRYNDLVSQDIDVSGRAGISLFDAKPYNNPIELDYVERHPLGSQAFIPMSQDSFIVIVADDQDGSAVNPKVFITNGTQGVNYKRNIWHGVLTPIKRRARFAVIDYIGEDRNLEEFWFDVPYLIEW